MAKENTTNKQCETCMNLLPIGEGDHLCDANDLVLVMEDYSPTDDYYWCCGRNWEEKR